MSMVDFTQAPTAYAVDQAGSLIARLSNPNAPEWETVLNGEAFDTGSADFTITRFILDPINPKRAAYVAGYAGTIPYIFYIEGLDGAPTTQAITELWNGTGLSVSNIHGFELVASEKFRGAVYGALSYKSGSTNYLKCIYRKTASGLFFSITVQSGATDSEFNAPCIDIGKHAASVSRLRIAIGGAKGRLSESKNGGLSFNSIRDTTVPTVNYRAAHYPFENNAMDRVLYAATESGSVRTKIECRNPAGVWNSLLSGGNYSYSQTWDFEESLTGFSLNTTGSLVDTFTVDADDPYGGSTNIVLSQNKVYKFIISGLVTYNSSGHQCDAVWRFNGSSWVQTPIVGSALIYFRTTPDGGPQNDPLANGRFVDESYQSSHTYVFYKPGDDHYANLILYDTDSSDNSGSFTVNVYEVDTNDWYSTYNSTWIEGSGGNPSGWAQGNGNPVSLDFEFDGIVTLKRYKLHWHSADSGTTQPVLYWKDGNLEVRSPDLANDHVVGDSGSLEWTGTLASVGGLRTNVYPGGHPNVVWIKKIEVDWEINIIVPGVTWGCGALQTFARNRSFLSAILLDDGVAQLATSTNGGNSLVPRDGPTLVPITLADEQGGVGTWPFDSQVLFLTGAWKIDGNLGIYWTDDYGLTWNDMLGDWETVIGTFNGIQCLVPVALPVASSHDGSLACTLSNNTKDMHQTPAPISLRLGEKREEVTDITVQTATGVLSFTRAYRQSQQGIFQFMGMGWTHNHAYKLSHLTGDPNRITVLLGNGGEVQFTESTSNHYPGNLGSTAVIDWDGDAQEYTLTASDHSAFVFDSGGNLLSRRWPNGEFWSYSYVDGKLSEVSDGYGRTLQFSYINDPEAFDDGQLWRVGDQTASDLDTASPSGRYIEFGYQPNRIETNGEVVNGTASLLHTIVDVRGNIWTYVYYGQAGEERDFRQLNFLVRQLSPSVDKTGDGVPDSSVVIKDISYIMQGTELVVNGGMENDSDWVSISGAAPTTNERSTVEVDTGTYSRHIVTSAANQGIEGNTLDLIATRTYIVQARVYPISGAVKMQGSGISALDRVSEGTNDWETLTVVYQAVSTLEDIKLQFIASGGAAEFYVDAVSIVESDLSIAEIVEEEGDALRRTDFLFDLDRETTVEITAGKTTTHQFLNGNYAGSENPMGNLSYQRLDLNHRPYLSVDANSNQIQLEWSEDDKHLEQVTDALGQVTGFDYNEDDTLNFSLDAEGRKTQYVYGDSSNPRQPTEVKVIDPDEMTVLRWQKFSYDSLGRTLTEELVDPADDTSVLRRTSREYYTSGSGNGLLQTITQEDLETPANDVTTTYFYDSASRVVQVNQSAAFGSCTKSYTVYDTAGNVVASICNYENAGSAPTTVAEAIALYDPDFPETNQVTLHEYDTLGRRFKTTLNAGAAFAQTTLTVFDALNRVVRTIRSYAEDAAVPDPFIADREDFDHGADNTQNLVTDTAYNERGLVRREVDVPGNVVLYGYDDVGRLIKTVQSASDPDFDNSYGVGGDPELSSYDPVSDADLDIITTQAYDAAGNLVQSADPLGRVSFTVYDALNRPVKTIRSAKPEASLDPETDSENDPLSDSYIASTDPDRDLIELTEYDALGRVICTRRLRDNRGIGEQWEVTLFGYDSLGRQVQAIHSASDPEYDIASDPDLSEYVPSSEADEDILSLTVYDVEGRVLYTEDTNGNRTWQAYDGLGRMVKTIVNAVGTATDGGTNDPRSDSYVVSNDADKDLISQTVYDDDGRVRYTVDVLGRKHWNVYDSLGRRVKGIQNTTWLSGTPAPEDEAYTGSADSDKDVITRTVFNGQGRVFAQIDSRGNETRFEYDALGKRTKVITNYDDGVWSSTNPDLDLVSTAEYDLAGRVTVSIDAAGIETHFEHDALGRRLKTIANYVDGLFDPDYPDEDVISETIYDKAGQVVATLDPRGTQTAFGYDAAGRRVTLTRAAGSPFAVTSYICFDKAGRVLRSIEGWLEDEEVSPDAQDETDNWLFDPPSHGRYADRNLITRYTLDKLGRVTAVADPLGNTSGMVYFKDGAVKASIDPLGIVTSRRYDRLRRLTRVVQNHLDNGEDPGLWVWDSTDERWEKSGGTAISHGSQNDQNVIGDQQYDQAGRLIARRDARGNLTSYDYDLLERRIELAMLPGDLALERIWQTSYADLSGGAGMQVTLTDPMGFDTLRTFDRLGRLVGIDYLDESPKLTPDVTFTYDQAGDRVLMSESDGSSTIRTTQYLHDDLRRLVAVGFDEDGNSTVEQTVQYDYDAGGLRTKLTLPGGLEVVYTYNARGELVSLTDWDDQNTHYAYGLTGRLIAAERDNSLRSRYEYDAAGRLCLLRHTANSGRRTLGHFAYDTDARGNRIRVLEALPHPSTGDTTLPHDHAAVVKYGSWATVGDFAETSDLAASLRVAFFGDEVTITLGVGPDHGLCEIYLNHSFWQGIDCYAALEDEREIVINLDGEGPHTLEIRNQAEKNLASSGFTLRVKQVIANREYDLHVMDYNYDGISRLTDADYYPGNNVEADPFRQYDYAYDLAGNRTQQVVTVDAVPVTTDYTYNALNQLIGDGSDTYEYDDLGNLWKTNSQVTHTWDRANRLLSFGGVSYAYNGQGQRISQTANSVAKKYLLDVQPGLWKVLAETEGTNTTRYLHGPMGVQSQEQPNGEWIFPIVDALGSVRDVMDAELISLESRLYSPYGEPFGTVGAVNTSFGFTNEPTDSNGLIHLRARYYNPAMGSFFSPDPLEGSVELPLSLNPYTYAQGNVTNWFDPSGESPLCAPSTQPTVETELNSLKRELMVKYGVDVNQDLQTKVVRSGETENQINLSTQKLAAMRNIYVAVQTLARTAWSELPVFPNISREYKTIFGTNRIIVKSEINAADECADTGYSGCNVIGDDRIYFRTENLLYGENTSNLVYTGVDLAAHEIAHNIVEAGYRYLPAPGGDMTKWLKSIVNKDPSGKYAEGTANLIAHWGLGHSLNAAGVPVAARKFIWAMLSCRAFGGSQCPFVPFKCQETSQGCSFSQSSAEE